MKSKEASKIEQKLKEKENTEIKSVMKKDLEASGKSPKGGKIQVSSNVREYSAQMAISEVPASEKKKVTTESIRSRLNHSGIKSKT